MRIMIQQLLVALLSVMALLGIMSCASSKEDEFAKQRRMIEEYFAPKMYGEIASQARKWKDFRGQLDPKDPSMVKINEFKEQYGYPLT